jgi:MSHA biogenesis protein MshQ
MSEISTGGTVNISVTTSNNDHWAMGAVPVKPAPAGPPTSLVLPPWTPQSGELLLVGVVLRDETVVPSVSGNGLTWTQVADKDNDRGQMGVNMFRASGASPTTGSITISLPGNTLPAYAVAVRLSNVDTTVNQGIEAVATASGPSGTDNDDMKVTVTTLTANAMALAWGGQRGSATVSLPSEETMIEQSTADCGTSGDRIRGHMWREMVPTPGPTTLGQDNSLSSANPWAAIGVSIKPVPPLPPQPPGRFNAFEQTTAAGALTGVIRTKIAGNTVSLDVIALNSQRTAVDTAFTGTVKVEVLNASSGSPGTDGCNGSWPVIQTLSNPTFSAGDNGRKTISFSVPNAYTNVRLRVSYPTSSPTQIGCSSDNFAIRPAGLVSFAISDLDWQTAGTTRALSDVTLGSVTHKAGRPMSVRASAVNATGTTVTSNYTGAPTKWLSACAGAACTSGLGTLTLSTNFTAGQLASDVASYDNVGSFVLQLVDSSYASVDVNDTIGDCGAGGSYVCTATMNVGRFVPDHFTVSLNTPTFTAACSAFTYLGQTFNYGTQPQITVTARNFAGATSSNYAGALARITNSSLTPTTQATRYYRHDALGSGNTPALDLVGLPPATTDPTVGTFLSGTGTLTFSSGSGLFFARTALAAPFDADVRLEVNVIDADGVAYASNPVRFGQAGAGNGMTFNSGKAMRFGRLAMRNANGSQLVPLPVRVEAQYWSGTAFLTNTLDSCSTIMSTDYAMSAYSGNLSGSPTCETAISGGGTLSSGRGTLILATPGAGNDGSVILTPNLGPVATGSTCATQGAAPVSATTANLPHLRGNWSGGAYDENPSARATFGIYKGAEEVIFMRENF